MNDHLEGIEVPSLQGFCMRLAEAEKLVRRGSLDMTRMAALSDLAQDEEVEAALRSDRMLRARWGAVWAATDTAR